MTRSMLDILETHLSDPRFARVIGEAVSFLSSRTIIQEHGPTGAGQPCKSVADLHAFRRRSGYYDIGAIMGLDETIEALGSCDTTVHLRTAETDKGYVALWLDDQDNPLGVMIFKTGAGDAQLSGWAST